MLHRVLEAAERLGDDGTSVEVIDLRSLAPLDIDTVVESVSRTHRLVITHEAPSFLGVGAEIASQVAERCFYQMEAPVLRVGGFAVPYPPSRLEGQYLPDIDRILDATDRALAA
jgi:pyruvate dehydrogenase E1 component beta subunit